MTFVILGGTGQIGTVLQHDLRRLGHRVIVVSRSGEGADAVAWDGRTVGPWAQAIDGADVVVNLAGRTVNCRYTERNLREMMTSRVDSTRVVGEAIARAARPPRLWLQMSTATIYAHRFDAPNDEHTGVIGGQEPDAPAYWRRSIEIAQAWEAALDAAPTPQTRKVALRTAMVMSPDPGGVFDVLRNLARAGLGGAIGGGAQFVSWIHHADFCRAVEFVVEREDLGGAINFASPHPLPQREMMAALRQALHVPIGLPATKWMAAIGAFVLRTDTELVLKSRRVVPARLLEAGFEFLFPTWPEAAADLLRPATEGLLDTAGRDAPAH
ncbi:MAG TPA: TIGR01777 family oxidoreductase [Polyangia bacterium]|nr:TIGR01777 family oxidoreductase [Polyangia bacterium]